MVRFLLLMPLLLAGCVQTSGALRLWGGDVVVAAPAGYCVNQSASTQGRERAVTLLGKCVQSGKVEPALITISFGDKGSGLVMAEGPQALARHLKTPAGRASLARDGRAASVKISQMSLGQDELLLELMDRRSGRQWRAFLPLKGRLTSISVQAPQGASLREGRALLLKTLAALRKANPSL